MLIAALAAPCKTVMACHGRALAAGTQSNKGNLARRQGLRRASVSLEPRKGTWRATLSSARMHSFSASRLLLISAPSSRVCLRAHHAHDPDRLARAASRAVRHAYAQVLSLALSGLQSNQAQEPFRYSKGCHPTKTLLASNLQGAACHTLEEGAHISAWAERRGRAPVIVVGVGAALAAG